MNYTKLEKKHYTLHLIETNKFKTVSVRINFRNEIKEEMITERELLAGILSISSNKYPKRKDFVLRKEELYQLGCGFSSYQSGNVLVFSGNLTFIHEKYTEQGMNKASLEFFLDTLMYPHVFDDAFDTETFMLEKRNYLEFLEGKNDNPNRYASWRLDTLRGRGTPLSFDQSGDSSVLKSVDERKLYEVYKNMLKKDTVDVFVIGSITKEEIEPLLDTYLDPCCNPKKELNHFLPYPKGEPVTVEEESDFKQSKLKMSYFVENMTAFERNYVLRVYNFLLGGSSDSLLFQNVREKNSLCYDVHSSSAPLYDMITISAGIESKDYEKTVSLIKEGVEKMRKGDFSEEELEKVKLNYQTSYEEIVDSESSILGLYESCAYLGYDSLEDRIKGIASVTKEMVRSLAERVVIDATYLLKGSDMDA